MGERMSHVWQTEENSKLGSEEGNSSGYKELTVLCSKWMEELEDMVNQKLNSLISLAVKRFEEINQRILAIGQTIEKLEVAVEKLLISSRSNLEKTLHNTKQRCMKLQFNSNIYLPILTGEPIKGEGGNYLQLSLIDNCTGTVVNFGREASAKVEIVALEGDLDDDERDTWTAEEFRSKIVQEREGKRSILAGNLQLQLNKGTVFLSDVKFRSSQHHISGVFKLGAWAVDNSDSSRVIEAKTKSFRVNDYRRKYNQKHHPPSASDEVWRLENIGKGGPIHDRLKREKVNSVKDFQIRLSKDPKGLKYEPDTYQVAVPPAFIADLALSLKMRAAPSHETLLFLILIGYLQGLPAKKWEATVSHAQTCIPDNVVERVPAPADPCNMSVASADEDKGVTFDVKDSLLQSISSSSNTVVLLNSQRLERSRGQDIEASEMGECDPTILNSSFGKLESCNTICTDDVEIMKRSQSSSQGPGPHSPSDSPLTFPDIDLVELKNLLDLSPWCGIMYQPQKPRP